MNENQTPNEAPALPAVRSTDWLAVTEWEHPDWDMKLILPNNGSRGAPDDYLTDGQDAALLKARSHSKMSTDQLDNLPEWDG